MKGSLGASLVSGVLFCTAVCLPFNACTSKIMQIAKINSSIVPALNIKQL